jgi:hypothetical protein
MSGAKAGKSSGIAFEEIGLPCAFGAQEFATPMKTPALSLLIASLAIVPLAATHAASPGKGKRPGPAVAAESALPEKALAPYIEKLDVLLALDHPGPAPFREQAPGHLAVLRQRFATAKAAASGAEAGKFTAAIATCDALTGAIEERQRTASEIRASRAVSGSDKLNAPGRKDALNQGVRGGDLAKAVGEVQERKREQAEKQAGRRATAQGDASLTAMAINRWNQHAIDLRKKITASYARISA